MLLPALINVVMVVYGRNNFVAKPGVGILSYQQRLPEDIKIFRRINLAFHQTSHFHALIGDAERGVESGNLQPVERELAPTSDFPDDVKVLFANGLCKFVDCR